MRPDQRTWYAVHYVSTPDLRALSALRALLGPDIPLFFRRGEAFAVTLYLPPEAASAVAVIGEDGRLRRFDPCEKPEDDGELLLLSGAPQEAARYFDSFRSNVVGIESAERLTRSKNA